MASDKSSTPDWAARPPSLFDIVTGFFPETNPRGGTPSLRPLLVTKVLRNKKTSALACEVAYGTTTLKTWLRADRDVIIQNSAALDEMGLATATRFVLDLKYRVTLPWGDEHFACWSGKASPRLGTLTVEYQKDYAFAMMRQFGV